MENGNEYLFQAKDAVSFAIRCTKFCYFKVDLALEIFTIQKNLSKTANMKSSKIKQDCSVLT